MIILAYDLASKRRSSLLSRGSLTPERIRHASQAMLLYAVPADASPSRRRVSHLILQDSCDLDADATGVHP
jgi:hypothetical protein